MNYLNQPYTEDDYYPALPRVRPSLPPSGPPRGFANMAGKMTDRQQRLLAALRSRIGEWMTTREIVELAGYEWSRGNGWTNTFDILRFNLRTQEEHGLRLEKSKSKRRHGRGASGHASVAVYRVVVCSADDEGKGGGE